MSELPQDLERLANRGTKRGADSVFAAAQVQPRPMPVRLVAIAAAVMLVTGVAAAMTVGDDSPKKPTNNVAIAPTSTSSTDVPTTTLPEQVRVFLASTRLVPFDACPSLASYAKSKALDVVGPYGLPGGGGSFGAREAVLSPNAGRAEATAGGTASDGAAPPAAPSIAKTDDFSTTNVQEAGIDEPDSVKTDGKTIFTIANGKVFATRAGGDPAIIGSVAVQNASELLLVGDKLIVLGSGGYFAYGGGVATDAAKASFAPTPNGPTPSRFTVFDVSNPAAMKFTGSFDVEGSYVSARLVDGVARIVVQSYPRFQWAYPTDGTPEANAAATEKNRAIIRNASADTWLPHFTTTSESGQPSASKPLTTCAGSYRPPTFSGFGMLSVVTFNASKPTESKATSVMADGNIVYASPTRMYVATNAWDSVAADSAVMPSANTLVHSFDISDPTNAAYRTSGRIRGTVLNQFSLSELNGVLRVATTDPNGGSESFMTALRDDGTTLATIGQVGGLGRGERIYAVRFIDTSAYVVTFRQVDPLYVIDLRDPTAPRVAGELKITGYSAYLHPIGPGLLLGIGQEATETGQRVGLAASIFDVRNPAEPKLVARKVIENGGSSAEFDHHAFLYWPATNLVVIPVNTWSPNGQMFNGAIGMRIGEESITEVGRIQHPEGEPYYGGGIERSLVIGSRLYTTSYRGILSNRLDNLESLDWIAYPT